MIVRAIKDQHTCEKCLERDGTIIKVRDDIPPFHPPNENGENSCRCVLEVE